MIAIVVAGFARGGQGVPPAGADGSSKGDSLTGPPGFVAESTLPAGFPSPGPVDQAVIKRYPGARAVQTPTGQFMRLFGHISRENVSMTTPVMMTPNEPDAAPTDRRGMAMAFFYPSTDMGETGVDGSDPTVEVVDMSERVVVSYAFFGNPTPDRLAEARDAISAYVEAEGLADTGGWALMGYNSPMVQPAKRLYELQLEVTEPVASTDEAPAPTE